MTRYKADWTKGPIKSMTAIAAALLIAGCSKGPPEGQVLARVNGEEITQSELNTELAAAGVPTNMRTKATPAVLQRVIERKLLVQQAQKDKVDQDPEYLLLRQRADETLLAQRYLQRQSQGANRQPSADQIDAYLRDHPAIGDQRQILSLDQVRFPTPTDTAVIRALSGVQTMDGLLEVLRANNIGFQREAGQADSATLPDELLANINRLKPGEPVVILGGPVLTAAVVTGRQPAPTTTAQATEIAKRRITSDAVTNRLKQQGVALRQSAKIDYAKGMAPPAPAKAGR